MPPVRWSLSKAALVGLNLVIFFLLLRWTAHNIDFARLVGYLAEIPVWAIVGSLAIYMATLGLYGLRMALFLGRGFFVAFAVVSIGYALNALIPLRLGEAMKIILAHRLFQLPMTLLFSASVAEKLVDVFKLLLMGVVVGVFNAGEFTQVGVLLPILIVAALAASVIVLFRVFIVHIIRLIPKRGRLRRISIELHKHAGTYPMTQILLITVGIWILNIALVYFTINTFLPGITFGILGAVTLFLILALAVAVPSAPGSFGLFEAGVVAYLTQKMGVGNEAALAAAVIFHLVISLPQLILTGILLLNKGSLVKLRP